MITRNTLAAHKAQGGWALPPPIQSPHSCRSCMVLSTCTVAHASLEGGTAATFGVEDAFTKTAAHIGDTDASFLRHWLGLLELEQRHDTRQTADVWALAPPPLAGGHTDAAASGRGGATTLEDWGLMPATGTAAHCPAPLRVATEQHVEERQKHPLQGRCIGQLQLVRYEGASSSFPLYPHSYSFSLAKTAGGSCQASLAEQGFSDGDAAVLSVQDSHAAVNRARVVHVTATSLLLATRSRTPALEVASPDAAVPLLWRLDKVESETMLQCATAGLLELVSGTSAQISRLRGLIVHLQPPARTAHATYTEERPVEDDCCEEMAAAEYAACSPAVLPGTRLIKAHQHMSY